MSITTDAPQGTRDEAAVDQAVEQPRRSPAARPSLRTAATWLDDVVTIVDERRRLVVLVASAISLTGVAVAFLLPQLVPPRPLVGAAVGFAAALLSIAVALAVDSLDLTVRGARHVRAAGGVGLATLDGPPDPRTADRVAVALEGWLRERKPIRIAVVPASRSLSLVPEWADALAVALAARGRRVLLADLTVGVPGEAGFPEVVRGDERLVDLVSFDPGLALARIGAGEDVPAALHAVGRLAERLPSDLEVLLVGVPSIGHIGVLPAIASMDGAILLARTDVTPRVDLIAALDAVERTRVPAVGVAMLRPDHPGPAAAPPSADPLVAADDVATGGAEDQVEPRPTVGAPTTVDEASDPARVPPGDGRGDLLADDRAEAAPSPVVPGNGATVAAGHAADTDASPPTTATGPARVPGGPEARVPPATTAHLDGDAGGTSATTDHSDVGATIDRHRDEDPAVITAPLTPPSGQPRRDVPAPLDATPLPASDASALAPQAGDVDRGGVVTPPADVLQPTLPDAALQAGDQDPIDDEARSVAALHVLEAEHWSTEQRPS